MVMHLKAHRSWDAATLLLEVTEGLEVGTIDSSNQE